MKAFNRLNSSHHVACHTALAGRALLQLTRTFSLTSKPPAGQVVSNRFVDLQIAVSLILLSVDGPSRVVSSQRSVFGTSLVHRSIAPIIEEAFFNDLHQGYIPDLYAAASRYQGEHRRSSGGRDGGQHDRHGYGGEHRSRSHGSYGGREETSRNSGHSGGRRNEGRRGGYAQAGHHGSSGGHHGWRNREAEGGAHGAGGDNGRYDEESETNFGDTKSYNQAGAHEHDMYFDGEFDKLLGYRAKGHRRDFGRKGGGHKQGQYHHERQGNHKAGADRRHRGGGHYKQGHHENHRRGNDYRKDYGGQRRQGVGYERGEGHGSEHRHRHRNDYHHDDDNHRGRY